MPISEYISIIKDSAIILAVAAVVFFIYHSGANSVRVHDIEAVQKQIQANAATEERYHSEINDAFAEVHSQMGAVYASIDAQRKPLIVRVPASGRAVPGDSASPADQSPSSGGIDVRSGVNALERKYESALSDCRALKESWPK